VVSQIGEALLVPNHAVQSHAGVYILDHDGNLELVEVALGASSDKYSQVLDGNLNPGDLIVLNPSEL
jgi:HlyD family secretion protein